MCNLQSVLNPRKRDWLLLYKKDELTKIMRDNGKEVVKNKKKQKISAYIKL
jgi:hypothetical protein